MPIPASASGVTVTSALRLVWPRPGSVSSLVLDYNVCPLLGVELTPRLRPWELTVMDSAVNV